MKKQFGEYVRLARGAFGCSSLWAGDEHLLYVHGRGLPFPIVESYRRLRYADIGCVAFATTRGFAIALVSFGIGLVATGVPTALLAAAMVSGSIVSPGDQTLAVMGLVCAAPLAAIALAGLVWNLVRGRTCVCTVTAGGRVIAVRCANRVRVARRVVAAVADRIGAVAPAAPPEEVPGAIAGGAGFAAASEEAPGRRPGP